VIDSGVALATVEIPLARSMVGNDSIVADATTICMVALRNTSHE
jgi:hypothetical protein